MSLTVTNPAISMLSLKKGETFQLKVKVTPKKRQKGNISLNEILDCFGKQKRENVRRKRQVKQRLSFLAERKKQ